MINQLLASAGWVFDLIFFLVLILGTALGAYRGFVKGVAKLAGKVVSIIIAFTFCVSFANFLEACFGMTTAITTGIANSIAKNELYAIGISTAVPGAEIGTALKEIGISAFPRWMISLCFKKVELIPAGTTAATLIGSVLAKWISIVIGFLSLIILLRVGVLLVAKILSSVIQSFTPLRIVDQALGALLGFIKACVLLFLLFLLMNWLPIDGLHDAIESSAIIGKIFASDWFQNATSYAVSGKWLTKYLK